MKIFSIKNAFVSKNRNVNVSGVDELPKIKSSSTPTILTDDISLKNFNPKSYKYEGDENLDLNIIEQLRAELSSGASSSEKLAEALMNYVEKNPWHKRF